MNAADGAEAKMIFPNLRREIMIPPARDEAGLLSSEIFVNE
jgi:hypothetical protein